MRVEKIVPIARISYDKLPHDQQRTALYARMMRGGVVFPAVKCAMRPSGSLILRDGRHRLAAAMALGQTEILARFSTEPLRTP